MKGDQGLGSPRSIFDRHFWPVVLLLFAALSVPLVFREWVALKNEGLYDAEWHLTAMAELLERDLADRLPLAELLGRLDEPTIQAELDRHVQRKIGHLGLIKLKVFNRQGVIVYASDPLAIGFRKSIAGHLQEAFAGKVSSGVIDRAEYLEEYGVASAVDMAEVYVPIPSRAEPPVAFVLEAYYDYTPFQTRTRSLLIKNLLSLPVLIGGALFPLAYLYRSRQRLEQKVEALEAVLPICQHCKKIRVATEGEPERWETVEAFFMKKDHVLFSHGICHECMEKHYPQLQRTKPPGG